LNRIKGFHIGDVQEVPENQIPPQPEEQPHIKPFRKINMVQNNSIDDKKPKKKRISDIVYYLIYVFVLASIGAAVFFFYKFIG